MRHRTNDGQAVLFGRRGECVTLDAVVAGARGGQSQVLVVRGEAGIGKSALLDYVETNAAGCRIARSAGAEAEMELARQTSAGRASQSVDVRARLPR